MLYSVAAHGPYASLLCRFVQAAFPQKLEQSSVNIVDLIEAEFLGTKQHRYGPRPNPESLVMIRDVIREAVAAYKPIPIVVPWGSEKPDGSSIDIAELISLRGLSDLVYRIKAHYEPGAQVNIRIEDVSAPHLFFWRADDARREAAKYTSDMTKMVQALGMPIQLRPESAAISEEAFNARADELLPAFLTSLYQNDDSLLESVGWKGGLSPQMVGHYLDSYSKLYPQFDHSERVNILARYFAGALARKQLGLRGDEKEWGGKYLEVSLVPPIPGTEGQFARRVHYRTYPLSYTSQHVAPWRAKGYFKIGEDDSVCQKLAPFSADLDLQHDTLTITGEDDPSLAVEVRADYLL